MKVSAGLSCLALLLTAAPAAAEDVKSTKKAKAEKVVCRSERVVGSNLPERVCMTQAAWDATRAESKNTLNRINDRKRMGMPETGEVK